MGDFTVYRGKCSPPQLRDILLMAMTVKNIGEIEAAMLEAELKTPRFPDHIFLPASWRRGCINSVEVCNYEHAKMLRQTGIAISPPVPRFDIQQKTKGVMGISFWELSRIKKRSKSGNYFEASRNLDILLFTPRGDGPPFSVTFDICVREKVRMAPWGLKLHSRWLDIAKATGVKLEEVQE